jgi:hypothetical protein
MGNWRTVNMEGRVSREQAADMIKYLTIDHSDFTDEEWDALNDFPIEYFQMHRSLCGINQWVGEDGAINKKGNLSAKSPSEDDVLRELQHLAQKYDTLEMLLHMGGNYESEECVSSFIAKGGRVEQVKPLVDTVECVSQEEANARILKFLLKG